MSVVSEFRSFIAKGNVIDLAVGIIIGGAVSGIVNSLVNDVVMPVVGALIGGIDFSDYFIALSSKARKSVVSGKSSSVRLDLGGRRSLKNKKYSSSNTYTIQHF